MSDHPQFASSKDLYLRLLRYARPYLKVFAVSLLAATDPALAAKLDAFRAEQTASVLAMNLDPI